MKILNFGSLNIDYVYQVDHFVRPGETLSSQSRQIFSGGKGLNQSIALARSGVPVWHAGAVGAQDGGFLRGVLEQNHVDTGRVERLAHVGTGHAIIQVNRSGQNCILLYGGANQEITKEHVDRTLSGFGKGDFLLLQNEINQLPYLMERAHEKGMILALNPSPMNEKIHGLPLEYVDYFLLNEVEAADLCGTQEQDSLLELLSQRYPKAKIVLTLGKRGVRCKDRDRVLSHGVYQVPVVDTTAAGDTFTGYFIGSLAQGCDAAEALRLASIASSIAVSRSGAEASIPWMEEVKNSDLEAE